MQRNTLHNPWQWSRNDVFACIAPIYDWMNQLISFGLIHFWRVRAARVLALEAGEIGLDLGTGTADLAIAIARTCGPSAQIIGIDTSVKMLERGKLKLQRLGLHNTIVLRQGNATSLDLEDSSVDRCCSAFLIRNLADPAQSLREMRRVVRPGGRIVCLEVSHPPGRFLRPLFHFYFYLCAPLAGLLLGQGLAAYGYLPISLKRFPDAPHLKELMEQCGWRDVYFRYLHGGLVAIHVGIKR